MQPEVEVAQAAAAQSRAAIEEHLNELPPLCEPMQLLLAVLLLELSVSPSLEPIAGDPDAVARITKAIHLGIHSGFIHGSLAAQAGDTAPMSQAWGEGERGH